MRKQFLECGKIVTGHEKRGAVCSPSFQSISTATFVSVLLAAALTTVRIALAILPCLPMFECFLAFKQDLIRRNKIIRR